MYHQKGGMHWAPSKARVTSELYHLFWLSDQPTNGQPRKSRASLDFSICRLVIWHTCFLLCPSAFPDVPKLFLSRPTIIELLLEGEVLEEEWGMGYICKNHIAKKRNRKCRRGGRGKKCKKWGRCLEEEEEEKRNQRVIYSSPGVRPGWLLHFSTALFTTVTLGTMHWNTLLTN